MNRTIFHQPKNTMPRIESFYAFLSVDEESGNEGIVGAPMGPIACMPLIAADEARLSQIQEIAQQVANLTKCKIRLVKFTKREEIGFIEPKEAKCANNLLPARNAGWSVTTRTT